MASPSSRTSLPIFEHASGLASRPFLELVSRPTPVQRIEGAAERLWVKRDDRVSERYGGNKVRRWEWLLGRARERGVRTLVTVGGTGSTQVTSLCAHGVASGFGVTGVLFDQPASPFVEEALQLGAGFGGRLVRAGGYAATAIATLRVMREAERPMLIAPGASGPLANVAYVDAMLELGAQVSRGELPRPDRIVVACGSGGTTVGLAIGAAILGWKTVVVGVRITDLLVSNPLTLNALAYGTLRLLRREGLRGPRGSVRASMQMDHRFIGAGYGFSTPAGEAGARRYEELFGPPGEVTYSGKSMAALDVIAREHPHETILLWNTLSTTGRRAR